MSALWNEAKWQAACAMLRAVVASVPAEHQVVASLWVTRELRALVHQWVGIACTHCGGSGSRDYATMATWLCKSVPLGQGITRSLCDECWGTGRSDIQGHNLRDLLGQHCGVQGE